MAALTTDQAGVATFGRTMQPLPKGSPLSPSVTTTGRIEAMAMYASESVAEIHAIRPAGAVLSWLCEGADQLLAH